jgi:hypothetical protein
VPSIESERMARRHSRHDDGEKDWNGVDEDASSSAVDDEATGERSPADGAPAAAAGLPEGWTQRLVPRKNGHRFDPYWFSPKMSHRFNSLPQARRFLDCLERVEGDEVVAFDMYSSNGKKKKRLLYGRERKADVVGDGMEVARADFLATSQICSDAAHTNTSSHIATDSIVSSSTTSSLCSSSKLSLAAPEKKDEPSKDKARHEPLFKMRLRLNLDDPQQSKGSGSQAKPTFDDENDRGHESQKAGEMSGEPLTIQQLLSLAKQRNIEKQAMMTLSQLKQEARNKARANQKTSRRPQRRRRNGRHSKQKAPAADLSAAQEPLEKIEMNTGVLFLYRGENRRAKFVRWY